MHSKYGENLTILLTSSPVHYSVYRKIPKLHSRFFFKYYYYNDQVKKKMDMTACESFEIHNFDLNLKHLNTMHRRYNIIVTQC
jgi:hypothetical protein